MADRVDILVLAALPPELAPMRAWLGEGLRARVGELEVAAKAVGIGLPTATAGAVARIEALRPRAVVLTGTCGAFDGSGFAVGDVLVARELRLVSTAVVRGRAEFPAPMTTKIHASEAISNQLCAVGRGRPGNLATTLAVTCDDRLAARIANESQCAAQHLEAFGVAIACAPFGVPLAVVLGVANRVGKTGQAEWRTNHRSAGTAAAEVLGEWLIRGAWGLSVRT